MNYAMTPKTAVFSMIHQCEPYANFLAGKRKGAVTGEEIARRAEHLIESEPAVPRLLLTALVSRRCRRTQRNRFQDLMNLRRGGAGLATEDKQRIGRWVMDVAIRSLDAEPKVDSTEPGLMDVLCPAPAETMADDMVTAVSKLRTPETVSVTAARVRSILAKLPPEHKRALAINAVDEDALTPAECAEMFDCSQKEIENEAFKQLSEKQGNKGDMHRKRLSRARRAFAALLGLLSIALLCGLLRLIATSSEQSQAEGPLTSIRCEIHVQPVPKQPSGTPLASRQAKVGGERPASPKYLVASRQARIPDFEAILV